MPGCCNHRWDAGFMGGLAQSMVFIPIVSVRRRSHTHSLADFFFCSGPPPSLFPPFPHTFSPGLPDSSDSPPHSLQVGALRPMLRLEGGASENPDYMLVEWAAALELEVINTWPIEISDADSHYFVAAARDAQGSAPSDRCGQRQLWGGGRGVVRWATGAAGHGARFDSRESAFPPRGDHRCVSSEPLFNSTCQGSLMNCTDLS